MLKNHKILLVVVVLATAGMLSVLGIWLANSYRQHSRFVLAQADQALLNVFYDYIVDRDFPIAKGRSNAHKFLAEAIAQRYPSVQADSVLKLVEEYYESRQDSLRARSNQASARADRRRGGRALNPWFLHSRAINVDDTDLDTLSTRYQVELASMDVEDLRFSLELRPLSRKELGHHRASKTLFEASYTRPILVDPEDNLYLYAVFKDLWKVIIVKIAWQLLFALALILTLAGAFFALFSTVRKQNRLAILQRTFVNNMTHELKTPISTVMAALEAIQRYGAKDDKQRMERYLELSKRELEHLTQIVERVLQFNANASRGVVLDKSEFDLVDLARTAADACLLSAPEHTAVEVLPSADAIKVYADRPHIHNVLTNLIDNAIKYSMSPARVAVRIWEAPNKVCFSVEDNGIGIPKAYLDDVFDIFFRVPSGEIYNTKGFGIGLAYVKQVVEQHGGEISVHSEEGRGSKFTVILPK